MNRANINKTFKPGGEKKRSYLGDFAHQTFADAISCQGQQTSQRREEMMVSLFMSKCFTSEFWHHVQILQIHRAAHPRAVRVEVQSVSDKRESWKDDKDTSH